MAILKSYFYGNTFISGRRFFVTEVTETNIEFSNSLNSVTYGGDLQFLHQGALGRVFGSLDSLTLDSQGVTTLEVTDINISASVAAPFPFPTRGTQLFAFVLSGDDRLSGSKHADSLEGFGGDDLIDGYRGTDNLYGGEGADRLAGGRGHDWLDGGGSADNMRGGSGNDVYFVDNLGDRAVEGGSEGIDRVYSEVHHHLGANVEQLTLVGDADEAINGAGNELGNVLRGSYGANVLTGGPGDDTLIGDYGDDRLIPGTGLDQISGGRFLDADIFLFRELRDCGTPSAHDVIFRFQPTLDVLHLAAIDANLGIEGDQSFTFIDDADFSQDAGKLRYADGVISGDLDGDAIADFALGIANHARITADDILL